MKFTHKIHSSLLSRTIDIVVVGAGGTGSALLPRLAQLDHALLELGHPKGLNVTVYDSDIVSASNIGRQGFFQADIGQNKASVLVNRINMCFGKTWVAVPLRVTNFTYLDADIVIGCVDTRKARSAIVAAIRSHETYYIDSGNAENTGQVVIGEIGSPTTMARPDRLPTIADLFPEMLDITLDATDDRPSCSVAESLRKQSLVINSFMAIEIFNLLWMLFRHGELKYSGRFVNLTSGTSNPIRINTDVWASMGYIAPSAKDTCITNKKAA